jgi:hypothetical protein
MDSSSLPISALPEIREVIDGAERILKADILRIKRVLADPAATLPASIVECALQEAKNALNLLAVHSRQLTRWQTDTISDAERAEVRASPSNHPGNPPTASAAHRTCDRAR